MGLQLGRAGGSRWGSQRVGLPARRLFWALLVTLLASGAGLALPSAASAIKIERLFSGNCKETASTCGEGTEHEVVEPTAKEAEEKGYRIAGGFVPYGVTTFEFHTEPAPESVRGSSTTVLPEGFFKGGSPRYLRTDVPPGITTNPFAVPQCPLKDFTGILAKEEKPSTSDPAIIEPALYAYKENKVECPPDTVIGVNKVLTVVELSGKLYDVEISGFVYNLEPLNGFAATYGVALKAGKIEGTNFFVHTIIEGNVEWANNYHDYFEIHNIPSGVIRSRLAFFGNRLVKTIEPEATTYTFEEGPGGRSEFLRNPTTCNPPGPATTTTVTAVSLLGEATSRSYTTPVGAVGCENEFPFGAATTAFSLEPESGLTDAPDGTTTTLSMHHPTAAEEKPDVSDLRVASVTLPPGMTMNPSAAAGLEGCTPEEIGIGTRNPVTCPLGSRLGTVSLEVPTLPAGSLTGNIYLGKPANGPITGPPYVVYLDAESARYGVKVRLRGTITPNPETGQLTTTFEENPEAPFSSLTLRFNTGPLAPLANPLTCGSATTKVTLTPYSGTPASFSPAVTPFTVTGCPTGGAPFAAPGLGDEVILEPTAAGGPTTFNFKVVRSEGQRYLETIKTVLPEGLIGLVPQVRPCSEPSANAGTCPLESEIGRITVKAGSGSSPYTFNGVVYFTEGYGGAPYGLSIVVPAVAGPFNLGNVVTRAKIEVEPYTAQVVATANLPMIVKGIPIRLREMTLTLDRQNFYRMPTSCNPEPFLTTLTGTETLPPTASATATLESTVQSTDCTGLGFKPIFGAATSAKTSRKQGASLKVTISQEGHEAAIKESITTLPLQLPSRLSTLEKACPEAQGKANIFGCPSTSLVGHVTAITPALPGVMAGPVYIVSHGGEEFPNLDLILEGDGVRVILVGDTRIHNGITTTSFHANPDVPLSAFTLELPEGPYSLLATNGNLCARPLLMPTTLVGWNGAKLVQNTHIVVNGCFTVISHRRQGRFLVVGVKVPARGALVASGFGVKQRTRRVPRPGVYPVKVPLAGTTLAALRHHHKRTLKLRITFLPKLKGGASFSTVLKVRLG